MTARFDFQRNILKLGIAKYKKKMQGQTRSCLHFHKSACVP